MSPIPETALRHIPAWKKLGLKLKFAKEEPDDVNEKYNGQIETTAGKKRKTSDSSAIVTVEGPDTDKPVKKAKKSRLEKEIETERTPNGDLKPNIANGVNEVSPNAVSSTPDAKRKSVSFTPETKTQDGEGVRQLYKTWLDKQVATDPSFNPLTVNPALRSVIPEATLSNDSASRLTSFPDTNATSTSDIPPKKHKEKKVPKSPQRLVNSQSASPPSDHPVLSYLTTHHTSPEAWKFSKPLQNHLLKHLFSHSHFPPSYDVAILNYLRGLQGSARTRIRQQALSIREEDSKWLNSAPESSEKMDQETEEQCIARRKRDYDAAVARIKQQLREKEDEREDRERESLGYKEEWARRVRKRKRAEMVLWCVGEMEDIVEKPVALEEAIASPRRPILGNSKPILGEAVTIQSRGMGGVERISTDGIAKGSVGKKIVFGDDGGQGPHNPAADIVSGAPDRKTVEAKAVSGVQPKRKRKKKWRTGVPDDDSSSSSSDSSESEEEAPKSKSGQQVNGKGNHADTSSDDSDSDSMTSSSGNGESD